MKKNEILYSRLLNQCLTQSALSTPSELVHSLACIQAQDFPNAKWGMGVRIPGSTDSDIEKAISDYSVIRTWLFRGTLHIVTVEDLPWILGLLSKKLIQAGMSRNRQLGLDEKTLQTSVKLISKKLKDGKAHTRESINEFLNQNRIKTPDNTLAHLLQYSALNGIICFGPKKRSEFTFVLLDSVLKKKHSMKRDEALFELASRYFQSHGPATLKDFIWWSGLTVTDARKAVEMARATLNLEIFEGNEYFMSGGAMDILKDESLYLLPAFDSYLLGFRDRSIFLDDLNKSKVISVNGIFRPIIVKDGKIIGIWKRTLVKNKLIVETNFFNPPAKSVMHELSAASDKFAKFHNKEVHQIFVNDKIFL